ncbi:MAG: FkbM family methyltransferase [Solirubrobacteraceae bacterium]
MRARQHARPIEAAEPPDELAAIETALADPVVGPEMRALCSVGSRREARDRHAMSVLMAATLSRDAHTVDVGAHSGAVLREIVRCAPAGRHIAYEPIPELAAQLTAAFPAVTVRNAALSDENGEASFVQVDTAPEFSGFRERAYHGFAEVAKHQISVKTERLDNSLPEGFAPAFIKIDVEGAELLVLRGARETIRRWRPTIVFEHGIGAADRYETGPADIYELLVDDLDMRIFDLDGAGPYTRQTFDDVFAEPLWNFLAVG